MSEIPRWSVPKGTWVGVLFENDNGAWVRYEDHFAALNATTALMLQEERGAYDHGYHVGVRAMQNACIEAVKYVFEDYEEYGVATKEVRLAIGTCLEMLRNTEVAHDEPETVVK